MLVEGQRHCAHCGTTILDKGGLHEQGADDDEQEETVVEEALEHVELVGAEFARVDLVEDLHEHEGVEDDSVKSDFVHIRLVKVDLSA